MRKEQESVSDRTEEKPEQFFFNQLEKNAALQAALQTLILQTTLQLHEQIDLIPYLSPKHRVRVSQGLRQLQRKLENTLVREKEFEE